MLNLFTSAWYAAPKRLPRETAVCAVGDVHGCLDLMSALVDHLGSTILSKVENGTLVMIGDYIDRGPASLQTLSAVRDLDLPGCEIVRLMGNHDRFLGLVAGKDAIDAAFVESWLDIGGASTLEEFGLTRDDVYRRPVEDLRIHIRDRLEPGMADFLADLAPFRRVADYLFVHAGLDPLVALDDQDASDLLMIREPFLSGRGWVHDVAVVHGHTIRGHEALPHRVATDTGAFRTGVLSGLHLEGDRLRWLAVTAAETLDALRSLKSAMAAPIVYDGPLRLTLRK